ncbi:MAG: oxidoreductase [Candidatus Hadarchaeota archaeon]
MAEKLKLGVFKFASCDGCQLAVIRAVEQLPLFITENVDIRYFAEATDTKLPGPYDLALVEGSVSVPEHIERVKQIREQSKLMVTIGACATAGGIQSLRNWGSMKEFSDIVYKRPEWIESLEKSTPISEHVKLDYEIQGCPINETYLIDLMASLFSGKRPRIERQSVCIQCKRLGNICVLVGKGLPCMGPVTVAGCGALCPSYRRDCYSCFGPMEEINPDSLKNKFKEIGLEDYEIQHKFREFTGFSRRFREVDV